MRLFWGFILVFIEGLFYNYKPFLANLVRYIIRDLIIFYYFFKFF